MLFANKLFWCENNSFNNKNFNFFYVLTNGDKFTKNEDSHFYEMFMMHRILI